jgi:hypothetical protein
MLRSFTCCVGSGMESHALHGDGIYFEAGDRLWVNLYAPSTAEWAEAGVRLAMETGFPEGETATLRLTSSAPLEFTLALRRPFWAGAGFAVRVNGQAVPLPDPEAAAVNAQQTRQLYATSYPASSFVELKRTWRSGDTVEIALPKSLRLEPVPDDPRRVAILWGPLVLAGDLGPEPQRGSRDQDDEPSQQPVAPVFVAADRQPDAWLVPAGAEPGRFRSNGTGRTPDAAGSVHDVEFMPFYKLHRHTYSTYWDVFTPADWEERKAGYVAEAERVRKLEAATVAWLQPGEVVFEREFNYQGAEDAVPQRILGRPGRRGASWFSYDVPVEAAHPMTLILTYFTGDRRGTPATFDILVDGTRIAEERVARSEPSRFLDIEHAIPSELVRGKQKVTVRFQAGEGSQIATIFGLRMIRGDAPR